MMLGMTPEAMAFVVFSVGMLVLMGTGMNMGLALVLTGAGMAWSAGLLGHAVAGPEPGGGGWTAFRCWRCRSSSLAGS